MDDPQTPNDSAKDMELLPLWCWVSFLILIIAIFLALFIYAAFFTPASPVSIFRKIFGYAFMLSTVMFLGFAAWGAAKRTRYGFYFAIALLSYFFLSSLHTLVSELLEPYPLNVDWFDRLYLFLHRIYKIIYLLIWVGWLSYFVKHKSKFGPRNKKQPR